MAAVTSEAVLRHILPSQISHDGSGFKVRSRDGVLDVVRLGIRPGMNFDEVDLAEIIAFSDRQGPVLIDAVCQTIVSASSVPLYEQPHFIFPTKCRR